MKKTITNLIFIILSSTVLQATNELNHHITSNKVFEVIKNSTEIQEVDYSIKYITQNYFEKKSITTNAAIKLALDAEKKAIKIQYNTGLHNIYSLLYRLYVIDKNTIQSFFYARKLKKMNVKYGNIEQQNIILEQQNKIQQNIKSLKEKEHILDKNKTSLNEKTEIINLQKIKLTENEKQLYIERLELSNKLAELKYAQQEKALKDLEIKENVNQKIFLVVVISLLAVISLVVITLFFFKHQSNVKLNEQNNIIASEKAKVELEKKHSEELLLNILPEQIAIELKKNGKTQARYYEQATVLFTDFVGFTSISEKLTSVELVKMIDHCFRAFDEIISKYGLEKIKTIGDAYMCASGIPDANSHSPSNTIKAAIEIRDFIDNYYKQKMHAGELGFKIRIGINSGSLVAGVVGLKKYAYDIWGDTVNTASRLESSGEEGRINISGATYKLIKGEFKCEYRGKIKVKNKGDIDMYFVI